MTSVYKSILNLPRYLALGLILFYRFGISPAKNALLGPGGCCRFYPTCSEYAIQSINVHGVVKGSFYSVCRLVKCHPLHPGGFDPIKPDRRACHNLSTPESLLDLESR
ncbi:MAG: membrane protein insertion efficiency factor YidD [Verrucomicrobiae bacterium]|nr:membrane protein insertion efficiency factor YidD [Verrucomicrobiae bacterium]